MANPVRRGFRNLAKFNGRDTRGQFWPDAVVVLVIVFVLIVAGMAFAMNGFFARCSSSLRRVPRRPRRTPVPAPGHLDRRQPSRCAHAGYEWRVPRSRPRCFRGDSAARRRRLTPPARQRPIGAVGLLPVPFLLFGTGFFPRLMKSMMAGDEPDPRLFFLLFGNNILYLAALAMLMLLLWAQKRPSRVS